MEAIAYLIVLPIMAVGFFAVLGLAIGVAVRIAALIVGDH